MHQEAFQLNSTIQDHNQVSFLHNAHISIMFMKCDILGFGVQVCTQCEWWCVFLMHSRVQRSRMCIMWVAMCCCTQGIL